MSPPQPPLSIAIIGGGIAGLTLTIALLTHCPHLPITLYESAAAFGEVGAGVGFENVAVRTMHLIDPRISAAFESCVKGAPRVEPPRWFTVRVGDARKMVDGLVLKREGREVRLGEEVCVLGSRGGMRGGVHRARFLEELVKLVPGGVARFNKRLVDVREAEDGSGDAQLYFADGTTAQHTAVLGCDGIKSRTRAIVLGDDNAAKSAVFSGKYAYRGLIPMSKARQILGDDIDTEEHQMFIGYHSHVLTFPIANGTLLNVVAFSSRPTWDEPDWVVTTSRAAMLADFAHWSPPVVALLQNLQKPDIWALFNHPPAPTYFRTAPLVCLVGDAAHASTPHQGSGAGMCIEDVWILSQVLSQCRARADLAKGFAAYDEVRRPRSQRLVETSREAGRLWDFEGEGVGDDLEAFERNATWRMGWIWDYDIADDLAIAMEMMRSEG